jgi:hypothetical protein
VKLTLGYVTKKGATLGGLDAKFVEKLAKNLQRYTL